MENMELELDKLRRVEPGPRDENVLVLQGQHRSRLIWDADVSYNCCV